MMFFQATASQPSQAPSAKAQLKEDIRRTILDATNAEREARVQANIPAIPGPPPAPGTTIQRTEFGDNGIPTQVVDISVAFFIMCGVIIIGWPLSRAFGRRLERRAETPSVSPVMTEQLQRIEQAVDAMAIEIERISESQRFMAKLQANATPERLVLPVDRP